MKNILTVDLEEWFHANYEDGLFDPNKNYEVRVIDSTHKLLQDFEDHNAKATFFVLGYIAEKHPDLVREIKKRGHEIATHGYNHQLVYKETKEEFKEEVKKAKEIVEDTIGAPIKGFRAPSWSIMDKSKWAWEVLEGLGFKYDASVFPIKLSLYGMPSSPRFMYTPEYNGRKLNIKEVPASTYRFFGKNIPFSGGAYLRALPCSMVLHGIKVLNNKEKEPAVVYIHPREIDPGQPRLNLKFKDALIHYTGIKGNEKKLVKILEKFQFTSIEDFYKI